MRILLVHRTVRIGEVSVLERCPYGEVRLYAKMSQKAENVKLTILEAKVKGYHECSFAVGVGEKLIIKTKRRDPALKETDKTCTFAT